MSKSHFNPYQLAVPYVSVPASSTATGIPGQRAIDLTNHYIYECVATNSWVRYALLPYSPWLFNYVSSGDSFGIFYAIGSSYGLIPWANPTPGTVVGLFSSTNSGSPTNLTDRDTTSDPGTTNVANSWLAFDLGSGKSLVATKYTLRNRNSDGTRALRNFKLQGTNTVGSWDISGVGAATWTDIDTRVADTTMTTVAASWAAYTISGTPSAYRYFRLLQNGTNALADNFLLINEWEFYGTLVF